MQWVPVHLTFKGFHTLQYRWISSYSEGGYIFWVPVSVRTTSFNVTCRCPFHVHWPCYCNVHIYVVVHFRDSNVVFLSGIESMGRFVTVCLFVSGLKWKSDCSFCWYWWNSWPSLFKLSFHIMHIIIINKFQIHGASVKSQNSC